MHHKYECPYKENDKGKIGLSLLVLKLKKIKNWFVFIGGAEGAAWHGHSTPLPLPPPSPPFFVNYLFIRCKHSRKWVGRCFEEKIQVYNGKKAFVLNPVYNVHVE